MDYLPHTVLVDCTATTTVAACYADWLGAGIHIVTPNKKANSADLAAYRHLQQARRAGGSALPLRGHRRRGTARGADGARPARDRR